MKKKYITPDTTVVEMMDEGNICVLSKDSMSQGGNGDGIKPEAASIRGGDWDAYEN